MNIAEFLASAAARKAVSDAIDGFDNQPHPEKVTAVLEALAVMIPPLPPRVVEVRQAILWNDEREEAMAIDPSGLKDWWPGFRHIGFGVLEVEVPVLPTFTAAVASQLQPAAVA